MFIVKNIGKSCYIDTLFMALFYINTNIRSTILNCYNSNNKSIYAQEYIKYNFINNVTNNISLLESDILNLKKIFTENDWFDSFDHIDKIEEFYEYILTFLTSIKISIEREYFDTDIIENLKKMYITIKESYLTEENLNINNYINKWIYDPNNPKYANNIVNIPYIMGISIKRKSKFGSINRTKINIMKGISPTTYNIVDRQPIWKIHSVICYEGNDYNSGHYYCIMYDDIDEGSYYLYDNSNIPCVIKVDISNNNKIADKIKRECIFLIYKYVGYK